MKESSESLLVESHQLNIKFALLVSIMLIGAGLLLQIFAPSSFKNDFAYEYGNIAEAILEGYGFSNPFGYELLQRETIINKALPFTYFNKRAVYQVPLQKIQPTAWMPPLYVFLIVIVFFICGIKTTLSFQILLLLQFIASGAIFYMLQRLLLGDQNNSWRDRSLLLLIYLFYIGVNWQKFFFHMHDIWIVSFMLVLCVYSLRFQFREDALRQEQVMLCLVAVIIALGSPAVAVAYFLVGLFLSYRGAKGQKKVTVRAGLLLIIFFGLSAFLWGVRNYNVHQSFVPVKSNFWFDFYQANVLDENGVVGSVTFQDAHPINNYHSATRYFSQSEQEFMKHCQELSFAYLANNPGDYFWKSINRAINSFIYLSYTGDVGGLALDSVGAHKGLAVYPDQLVNDLLKLEQIGLLGLSIVTKSFMWRMTGLKKRELLDILEVAQIANKSVFIRSWEMARQDFDRRKTRPFEVAKNLSYSLLPFGCILLLLISRWYRQYPIFKLMLSVYIIYLLPYIMVSHYERYQLPLISLQICFVYMVAVNLFRVSRISIK